MTTIEVTQADIEECSMWDAAHACPVSLAIARHCRDDVRVSVWFCGRIGFNRDIPRGCMVASQVLREVGIWLQEFCEKKRMSPLSFSLEIPEWALAEESAVVHG